ncbi:centrosomal protein 43 isoform X1 [Monodelphis domestica]|uniref:centrosomal protein 43 isoform X1 n=1 Tax=Monodelphis domestica TaxID=13616 RepID=UPI0000F2C228|nr:centrosomal protein 43 isoform X1 [Monodelphis domestica]XP_056674991.1 centrosomal protein 43 isoform X1 [Monodelphis domestica]
MAATTAAAAAAVVAAATEEDTELRDLLVQTLENSGVLNRIKAELRAAVFLALEEQEKVENKTPLVNESLKKFLNTKDGRLVASLVAEFLQFFNLDFTLAVFQPETSTVHGLEARENLARDLGIIEAEGTVGGPLLLEVIRRCQHKERGSISGEGELDLSDLHSPPKSPDGRITSSHTVPSKIPRYKGQGKKKKSGEKAGEKKATETNQTDTSISSSSEIKTRSHHILASETKLGSSLNNRGLDGKDKVGRCPTENDMDGDSFFDDPIPKPEKSFGWKSESSKQVGSLASLSDAPPLKSGLSSLTGTRLLKESENSRGSSVLRDLKMVSDKIGSLGLGTGDEEEYMDDFNSTISHRSEKSEISIGEEIEEDISVELDDININDKLEDLTQDLTVSQLSDVADYLEDVA